MYMLWLLEIRGYQEPTVPSLLLKDVKRCLFAVRCSGQQYKVGLYIMKSYQPSHLTLWTNLVDSNDKKINADI